MERSDPSSLLSLWTGYKSRVQHEERRLWKQQIFRKISLFEARQLAKPRRCKLVSLFVQRNKDRPQAIFPWETSPTGVTRAELKTLADAHVSPQHKQNDSKALTLQREKKRIGPNTPSKQELE